MKQTYRIKLDFDAAHKLDGYDGPCAHMHGHTWHVEFFITVPHKLDDVGIGTDFKVLKEELKAILPDHILINDYVEKPTAENLLVHLFREANAKLPCYVEKIVLWETEKNGIEMENDEIQPR